MRSAPAPSTPTCWSAPASIRACSRATSPAWSTIWPPRRPRRSPARASMSSADSAAPPSGDEDEDEPPARWLALPIFPLPKVQLFPHALLPLHVFEPRYRDMVRDAMAGPRLIAVAALEPGF